VDESDAASRKTPVPDLGAIFPIIFVNERRYERERLRERAAGQET
jgi:hypothetical protein